MRQILFAIIVAWSSLPALYAQDMLGKIACHADGTQNPQKRPHTKKLWAGYEISVGPARGSQGEGDACAAAIYNSVGRVVFRTTAYSVILDEDHTGQDFDGDGKPEVVLMTDTGGGMHCCWAYNVISLSPKPHKLFDIEASGAVRFEKDSQGNMVIWQRTAGPHGFTSMARTPFAERVFRVREGKLLDVTPELCFRIFSNDNEDYRVWNHELTLENLRRLQATGNTGIENEEIVSALLSKALQNVFCRRFDAALDDLNLWPEASRSTMKREFAESIRQNYFAFAVRLLDTSSQK